MPWPWLMTIWQAPVNAANLLPSGAVPLGRQHLSRPRWRVAQPAGYPVSVMFSTTRCSSVKSGWQQINCKLGRNKNDGKEVCELVSSLCAVLKDWSPMTTASQPTPHRPQCPHLWGVRLLRDQMRKWMCQCSENNEDLTATCHDYIKPNCVFY